jgi:PAS domain S-box-containing protein
VQLTNRILAEERLAELRSQAGKGNKNSYRTPSEQEPINDLQARQIELELQNAALHATQKQLNVSLQKYADLYDLAPVGYITLNRAGLIVENNLTFSDQLDRERTHLRGTPLLRYTAAEDRDRLQSHFARVFATNDRQTIELRLKKRSGAKFHAQLDTIPAPDDGGSQLCRTSVTDISTRKGVEQGLVKDHEELERRVQARTDELFVNQGKFKILSQEFQALLNAITDTLILFSPEMKVLWTNSDNAEQLHEIDSDTARQYCYTLIHNSKTLSPDPIKKCFETGEKEVAIETYHGAVLDLRAFPIKETGKVDSVLLLISDITEKMAMQAEAMQAGHMASLGELASGVAHEINNPITGIINYGQILINECRPDSMERDIGERIVKEGDRIGRIVRTLLSYARDLREEKKPTPISAILEESIILTQAQIRKEGIDLKINLSDDLPEIYANLQQIQQSFINIINNARYALNEKYPGRHEDKRFEISGEKIFLNGRPWVRLAFYDQGVGIAAHEIPLITKQFFSTKPFGKGTGLGLNITKKIIEDHGGRLSFESNAGEFTRVVILFPAEWCSDEDEQ